MTANNPIAIITGGARRIGQAMGYKLAELGFDIALHYNNSKTEAQAVADDLKNTYGINCQIFGGDLTDKKVRDDLLPSIVEQMGKPAVLINNASIFEENSFANSRDDDFDRNMNIHCKVPYFLSQSFALYSDGGVIINMVDSYINTTQPMHFPYLLSKKALAELTPMLARVLAPSIRVNAIAISHTEIGNVHGDGANEPMAEKMPLKSLVEVNDITTAVYHILEQKRMTGQILYIDSGHSLL